MNNKCKYLAMLTLAAVFLFYRVGSIVAMAAEQNMGPVAEVEPEEIEEPIVEPEPEEIEEPTAEPEPEETEEPVAEPEPEETEEPVAEPEPEEAEAFTAGAEPELIAAFSVSSESETVSTGEALMNWLESHKNTGGTVRLTDHVVLDGTYSFCPNGVSGPDLFVDTGQYTITVTGEIAFLSNGRLTFSGEPDGQGIFCVAEKGVLSLYGISVESDHCALWQEEGAGLEVSECVISGDTHYAHMPFVMYYNDSLCAVVEKGQTVNDALPTQINCRVNKQGQLFSNEPVALSWNLEGTERQQEERRRFEVQGSFSGAESTEPVRCTVVYNDYPLTFMNVSASVSSYCYTFQGGFTAPEESLPFTVAAEYSFDGENWIVYEGEQMATNTNSGFRIDIPIQPEQCFAAASSKIYIRLQWNDNGTRYFSNVLCYAADNVEQVDDIGGSRGGGTSIINPPDVPQQNVDVISSVNGEAIQDENRNTASDNDKPKVSAEDSPLQDGSEKEDQTVANEEAANAEILNVDIGQTVNAEPSNIKEAAQASDTESQDTKETAQASDTESQDARETAQASDTEPQDTNDVIQTTQIEQSLYAASKPFNKANLNRSDSEMSEENGETVRILIAAGFVLLSGIAGTAGFCFHSRSGTNR